MERVGVTSGQVRVGGERVAQGDGVLEGRGTTISLHCPSFLGTAVLLLKQISMEAFSSVFFVNISFIFEHTDLIHSSEVISTLSLLSFILHRSHFVSDQIVVLDFVSRSQLTTTFFVFLLK